MALTTAPTAYGGASADANGPFAIVITEPDADYPRTWHLWIRIGGSVSMHMAFDTKDRQSVADILYEAARDVLAIREPEAVA